MISISDEKKIKRACVTIKDGKYYFPKTIPRERDATAVTHLGVLLLILLVHFYLSEDWGALLGLYAFTILFYLGVSVVYRFILYLYELKHRISRYGDEMTRILKGAFYFNVITWILTIPCIIYVVYYSTRYEFPSLQDKYWLLTVPFLFFLHRLIYLEDFPLNDSLFIAKDNGLDYGSGMAYSFFFGYLNYMLDKVGEPNKNLKEMLEDYESHNGIKFAVHKIFILIPKSLNCFKSIHEVSKLMEMRSTLPEKQITVAGVRDRVYKHSVYTINLPTSEDTKVYVCTEYATPLKTFKEVITHTTAHTEYYNSHKDDILLQFYLTLKRILEDNQMHMMCELVFYEDMDEKNNFHDVGRILLTKIAEIKKNERAKQD